MRAGEVIIEILKERGCSQRSLAQKLNVAPQTLSDRLIGKGSIQVSTLVDMADALDYKVMIVPKKSRFKGYKVDS